MPHPGDLPADCLEHLAGLAAGAGSTLLVGSPRTNAATALGSPVLVERDAHLRLPQLIESGARFRLALADGRHLFDHLLVDLFYIDLLLEPGGRVAVNNATWPGLARAVAYFTSNRGYLRERGPERLATLRKAADDDRRGNDRLEVGGLFEPF
jgi:hypothetical protein